MLALASILRCASTMSSSANRESITGRNAPDSNNGITSARKRCESASFCSSGRVRSSKFGTGTIAEVVGRGHDAKVKVDFDDEEMGRKTLVARLANLKREDD